MTAWIDGVSFAPGGQAIPVDGKPVVLFTREVFTYRDLPDPLAAAVGRALATQCFITLGYRHGPGNPLLSVMIGPGSGANSQNTCLYLSERQPGTVSMDLATHLAGELRNAGIPIHVLHGLLQANESPPIDIDFYKCAIRGAAKAMGSTMQILRAGVLSARIAGKSTCHGDEAILLLHSSFGRLLEGWLGELEASIHWIEDAHTLGVSAVKCEITTAPLPYDSFFRHAGDDVIYADVDGGWKCALRDTIIDVQGCVEFVPRETPTCLRMWLPLKLPDSF